MRRQPTRNTAGGPPPRSRPGQPPGHPASSAQHRAGSQREEQPKPKGHSKPHGRRVKQGDEVRGEGVPREAGHSGFPASSTGSQLTKHQDLSWVTLRGLDPLTPQPRFPSLLDADDADADQHGGMGERTAGGLLGTQDWPTPRPRPRGPAPEAPPQQAPHSPDGLDDFMSSIVVFVLKDNGTGFRAVPPPSGDGGDQRRRVLQPPGLPASFPDPRDLPESPTHSAGAMSCHVGHAGFGSACSCSALPPSGLRGRDRDGV